MYIATLEIKLASGYYYVTKALTGVIRFHAADKELDATNEAFSGVSK